MRSLGGDSCPPTTFAVVPYFEDHSHVSIKKVDKEQRFCGKWLRGFKAKIVSLHDIVNAGQKRMDISCLVLTLLNQPNSGEVSAEVSIRQETVAKPVRARSQEKTLEADQAGRGGGLVLNMLGPVSPLGNPSHHQLVSLCLPRKYPCQREFVVLTLAPRTVHLLAHYE